MEKGDAAQFVTENKKHKKTFREKLEDDNISGSVEKDAKIGLVFAAAMGITIGGVVVKNQLETQSAINTLSYPLVAKTPEVSSFDAEYIVYYSNSTCVGGIAVANQKEVEGYFTIDKGIAIDKVDHSTYATINSISYESIIKITEAAKETSVKFTEGKLNYDTASDEMEK